MRDQPFGHLPQQVTAGSTQQLFDEGMTNNKPVTHVDAGTSQLGYRATGAGPDLLFIHGWPLNRETWRDVVEALPDFRCHLIDMPGCGTSITPVDVGVSLEGHIDALTAVVESLGFESVTLIGQDSGGLVARNVAIRLAEVVSGLVLVGTEIPGEHPDFIDRLQAAMKIPGAKSTSRALLRQPKAARSPQLLGGLFSNPDLIEGDFRTAVLADMLDDPVKFERQMEILNSYQRGIVDDLANVHPLITCPTLLVWGEDDGFFPVEKARKMADQFGGPVSFQVIANARLLAYEEHPQQFASLVRAFLQEPAVAT